MDVWQHENITKPYSPPRIKHVLLLIKISVSKSVKKRNAFEETLPNKTIGFLKNIHKQHQSQRFLSEMWELVVEGTCLG